MSDATLTYNSQNGTSILTGLSQAGASANATAVNVVKQTVTPVSTRTAGPIATPPQGKAVINIGQGAAGGNQTKGLAGKKSKHGWPLLAVLGIPPLLLLVIVAIVFYWIGGRREDRRERAKD